MKGFIYYVIGSVIACLILVCIGQLGRYPMLARVITVDKVNDCIQIKNGNGFIYTVDDADDWEVGDLCSCIMASKFTEKVYDDVVVEIRYEREVAE